MVNSGFQETDAGQIPEDWACEKLEHFLSFISYGFTNPMPTTSSGIPMITAKDINEGRILFETARTTSAEAFNSLLTAKSRPRCGDILLTKDGTLGRLAVTTDETICVNQSVAVLRPNHRADARFLKLLLEAPWYQERMLEDAGGSTIKHIYITIVDKMPVGLPRDKNEQKAIAEALSDVDGLIAGLEALIAKKRDLKTATMQQLLTGKTRLPGFVGEWKNMRLGEVGAFSKGRGIKKDEVRTDGLAAVRYGEIYTRHHDVIKAIETYVSGSVAKSAKRLSTGDILFAASGETLEEIGKSVAFLGNEPTYAGGDIIIFSPHELDSLFLGYALNSHAMVSQKMRIGQGDAVVHIHATRLADLEIKLPPRAEQEAIGQCLADFDADIGETRQQLSKAKSLKQGMMQELLTGRTRLI